MFLQKRIVVVGSLNMDLVVRTAKLPAPGETVSGHSFNTYPGGKGANQAVAAARLAGPETAVHMVGRVGTDDFGAALVQSLQASGVDTANVPAVSTATGNAMIAVEDGGENFIIITAGANGTLTTQDMNEVAPLLQTAQVLLLQLEVPLPAVERAAALAAAAGAQVILNPAPAPAQPLPASLLQHLTLLVPNETEACTLAGVLDPSQATEKLLALGLPALVLTLGAKGAQVMQGSDRQHVPAYAIKPVDTTAAGDAFVAGLAVGLVEGLALSEAAKFAAAAGALAATRAGAQPSLPGREAVLAFMAERA